MKDEGIMIIYAEMSTGVPAEVIVIEWRDLGEGAVVGTIPNVAERGDSRGSS